MRIGFIGLGIMGEAMCYNIIRKHDGDVYIYDVKTEPVQRLAEKGGIACDSAVDAAKHSDVIITMLPRSEDSLSVYKEILPAVNATKICIDMSTIDPSVSLKISVMIQAHGGHFLDAPVVKSKAAAVLGNIGIYVGGRERNLFPGEANPAVYGIKCTVYGIQRQGHRYEDLSDHAAGTDSEWCQ